MVIFLSIKVFLVLLRFINFLLIVGAEMDSFVVRLLKSHFLYWMLAAFTCMFYFISFDYSKFSNESGAFVTRLVKSSSFKNLRQGIDLQGGTHLVLRLEEGKVLESMLGGLGRSLEKTLAHEGIEVASKSLNEGVLVLSFVNNIDFDKAYPIVQKETTSYNLSSSGLDFQISIPSMEQSAIIDSAAERAVSILRNRLDTLDVRGLAISRHGKSKLVVQLPGVDDISDIKESISRAAKLEFKIVHDQASTEQLLLDRYDGILPSDKMITMGQEDRQAYLVSIFADISGSRITTAKQVYDQQTGRPIVEFHLDAEGGRDFREVTRENIGSQLAVVMDGKVISAPNIQSEIGSSRSGIITGVGQKEGLRLAQLLRSGALESGLKIEQESRVGSSLGTDSIVQGLSSCLIALGLLLLFSIMYYRLSGFLACFALVYNVLILLLMLAFMKATLTLPGIAGIVLTVGMAIDASILIFERIKEELRGGVSSFANAVDDGFSDAMGVILDSNITTFLAGVVLFWYGGASVKGFAVTLMVGIISTVVTGVFFLRSLFDFCLHVLGWKKVSI